MKEHLQERVRAIVAETFGLDPFEVTDATSARTVPAWTSLGQLRLIATLEQTYGFKFTLDEMAALDSVVNIERILVARLPS
ncbi:MAG: acyl carrier protein [Ktedonobacterales bacterium]|nr:acyl carrier protein [Ktedonobacterales bacterium]